MGWGISIDQDDNGHVYCSDANWETFSQDYDDCPPSSYDFIRDYMDSNHHGEIDMARDEGSADLAHEACCEAFESAKYAYEDLTEEEQVDMHNAWLEKTRNDIANITVDEDATVAALVRIEELQSQIDKLKMELYHNQRIIRPSQKKKALERQLEKETEIYS
jgi:hypothetical protein